MKIKIFTQEALFSIFFPKSFWDQVDRLYDIPKGDMVKFKNQDAMLVYVLQMQQYQHGLLAFISEVAKQLNPREQEHFYHIAENIFSKQLENHVQRVGETCRNNILKHFKQKYRTMNTNNIQPITVTETNMADFIQQHPVALLDLWAPWCPPCKAIAPIIDQIATEYQDRVGVGKINIDEHQSLVESYPKPITSIPTLIIFKNGKELTRLVGAQSHTAIANALDQALT